LECGLLYKKCLYRSRYIEQVCHLPLDFFANPKLTELLHLVVSEPFGLKEDSYLAKVHFKFGTMSMSELIIAVF
jgi:hypothetical protein